MKEDRACCNPIEKGVTMSPVIQESEVVYQNDQTQVHRVVADFGDFAREYWVNRSGVRVGVVAVRDGKVLLVR